MTQLEKVPLWSGAEIAKVTGGEWISGESETWHATGVCYYPTQVQEGDIAVVTTPNKWGGGYPDTTRLIPKFFSKGAAAVIVDKITEDLPNDKPILLVKNTCRAVYKLARASRERFTGKIICITGSVGKTSTKNALYHVMQRQTLVSASRGNFNIAIQLALSLAQAPKDYQYCILEFAVDSPRHTLTKAQMALPHIAIMTDLLPAHLDTYNTLEALADQKCLLFDGLQPGGVAIINREAHLFDRIVKSAREKGVNKIITYGSVPNCDIQLLEYRLNEKNSDAKALVFDEIIEYVVGSPGRHMIINSLAVLATIAVLHLNIKQAACDLATIPPIRRRNQHEKIPLGKDLEFTLINDAYNAIPASMHTAFECLKLTQPTDTGRHIAVLGDMLTCGKSSKQDHIDLARPLIDNKIDKVFTFGTDIHYLYGTLPLEMRGIHAKTAEELIQALAKEIQPGDVVLVKGSNASDINKYKIIPALRKIASHHS